MFSGETFLPVTVGVASIGLSAVINITEFWSGLGVFVVCFEDGSRNKIYIFWGLLPYQHSRTNPEEKVDNLEGGAAHRSGIHRLYLENMLGCCDGTDILFLCLGNVFLQKEDMEHLVAF